MTRPRLLYVSSRWPWPVGSGRQKMIDQTLAMASDTHDVELLAVGREDGPAPAHVGRASAIRRPGAVHALDDLLLHPWLPLQAHLFASGPVRREVVRRVRECRPDVVMLDMARLSDLAGAVRTACPGVRVVVDMDDRLSDRYRQMRRSGETNLLGAFAETVPPVVRRLAGALPRAALAFETFLVARAERRAAWSDAVVFVSPVEAATFAAEHPGRTVVAVPPVVDRVGPARPPWWGDVRFVFLGNARYAPNAEALRILDEVAGQVRARVGRHVTFEAAGTGTDGLGLANVDGKGFMADMDAFLGPDAVMVAPVVTGTGIKTKLLDAMARGVCVVTTLKGREGLDMVDGRDCLVREVADMPDTLSVVAGGGLRVEIARMAEAAQVVARRDHAPEVVASNLRRALGTDA